MGLKGWDSREQKCGGGGGLEVRVIRGEGDQG